MNLRVPVSRILVRWATRGARATLVRLRFVHFYPFRPDRDQGGTLRLKTAVAATEPLGETTVVWFDAQAGRWTADPPRGEGTEPAVDGGLKRRVFPHTLYESGRHAVAALSAAWDEFSQPNDTIILHTSYLAPAIDARPAVVDVYDLVWRGHEIDARQGPAHLAPVRASYALHVRRKEERALSRARGLVVAGWDDHQRLAHLAPPTTWCPTGMAANPAPARTAGGKLRIGFLGNFAHQATVDSATALLRAPVAHDDAVEIVLGGWESDRVEALQDTSAIVLGPVATPNDFWREIDVATIPVFSGTGIKCKIAEAMLAGRGVITTPLGAAGFSPDSRAGMTVVANLDELDSAACFRARSATGGANPDQFTVEAAAATYRAFLTALG
ncbi:glycosyltransferase [Baekduia sp. Peel2402]|uniref:glycosyltransferase n=1 Tax=Baekduia sp. Peel2402 TaxID=3458296 RepID=UPI00403E87D9